MEPVTSSVPEINLAGHKPSLILQKRIGVKYALQHRIIVLSESAERIEMVIEGTSPVIMDEIRKMIPRGKEAVFFRADPREIEAAITKLYDPYGLSRYC
jgi:hypothetical protein